MQHITCVRYFKSIKHRVNKWNIDMNNTEIMIQAVDQILYTNLFSKSDMNTWKNKQEAANIRQKC